MSKELPSVWLLPVGTALIAAGETATAFAKNDIGRIEYVPATAVTALEAKLVDAIDRADRQRDFRYEVEAVRDKLLEKLAEAEKTTALHRDNYVTVADQRDKLLEKLAAASERERKSKEMLGWCIEAFEGTVPNFWKSPLGLRLSEALSVREAGEGEDGLAK